jgi:hypothetical protein
VAEPFLQDSAELREKLAALADDSDVRLRFQAALSLNDGARSVATF